MGKFFFNAKLEKGYNGLFGLSEEGLFKLMFGWILPIALIIYIGLSFFTIVKTSEVGVKYRLGVMVSDEPITEGLVIKIPFLDRIIIVSLKQHQENFTLNHTQTKDLQSVSVSYKVIYSIPASKVIQNLREINGDLFEVLIKPRANESIMDTLAKYHAEELISNRDNVSIAVKSKLSARISGHAKIDDIAIIEFDFENKEFKDAVQRKVIAKQDAQSAEIKKQQSQAEADQVLIKAQAEAKAIKIRSDALAGNQRLVDLTIAEKWDGKTPNTVVVGDSKKTSILLPVSSGQ